MDTDGVRLFVKAADMLNISAAGRLLGLAPAVAGAPIVQIGETVGCRSIASFNQESLAVAGRY